VSVGLFNEFLRSGDTLRVYCQGRLVFTSGKPGILPLLEYARLTPHEKDVTVFDRVVGNAAALLLSRIFCREVYSPLGSQSAGETLRCAGISYHFTETVPFIQNQRWDDMCPMERLSLGKDPEEFYQACLFLELGDKL
jgi:hypothetical protein